MPPGSRRQPPRHATAASSCRDGIHTIGHQGEGYCFDNERPAHRVLVGPVRIARALVTNARWLEFMSDGGYATPIALALRRLGHGAGGRLARARLLAERDGAWLS